MTKLQPSRQKHKINYAKENSLSEKVNIPPKGFIDESSRATFPV